MPTENLFTKCSRCGESLQKSSKICPKCNKRTRRIRGSHWILIVLLTLAFMGMITRDDDKVSNVRVAEKSKSNVLSKKDAIRPDLHLDYTWTINAYVSVMEVNLTISNDSLYDVKDIEINCEHYSASGTNIDSNSREIYEIFPSGSVREFYNFNMGFVHDQTDSSMCVVRRFKVVQQ